VRKPAEIEREEVSMNTLTDLSSVFEGIASMRIAKIKNQVLQSQNFFERLWQMYSQIRVGNTFNFGRNVAKKEVIDKELFIVINYR